MRGKKKEMRDSQTFSLEVMDGAVWAGWGFSGFGEAVGVILGCWRVTHCPVLPGGPETAAGPGRGTGDQSPHPAAQLG